MQCITHPVLLSMYCIICIVAASENCYTCKLSSVVEYMLNLFEVCVCVPVCVCFLLSLCTCDSLCVRVRFCVLVFLPCFV